MSTVPGTGLVLRIRPQRKGLSVTKTGAAAEKSEGRRFRGGRLDFTPLSLPLFRSVCENGALPAHFPHRDADERRREGQGARAAGRRRPARWPRLTRPGPKRVPAAPSEAPSRGERGDGLGGQGPGKPVSGCPRAGPCSSSRATSCSTVRGHFFPWFYFI